MAVSAQVEDEPRVEVTTTLPGAGTGVDPKAAADHAAEVVSAELDTDARVTAVAVVEPDAPTPEPSLELSLDTFEQMWPAVLEALEQESPMLAAMLREAKPAELADEGLTLAWPESAAFSKRAVEDPTKRELLAKSIRAVTGASLRLAHELRADAEVTTAAVPLTDDELVARFKAEFDAEELPPPKEEET